MSLRILQDGSNLVWGQHALRVILIIGIMSSVGLVTGFFLKHLDSVLKAVASALEAGGRRKMHSGLERFRAASRDIVSN